MDLHAWLGPFTEENCPSEGASRGDLSRYAIASRINFGGEEDAPVVAAGGTDAEGAALAWVIAKANAGFSHFVSKDASGPEMGQILDGRFLCLRGFRGKSIMYLASMG